MIRLASIAARFGPKKYKTWLKQHLVYADVSWSFEKFVALSYLYSIGFEIFSIFVLALFLKLNFITSFAISQVVFLISFSVFHLILSLLSDKRAKAVEEVLPDILKLVAMNLKSGMTVDRALLLSARSEFGVMEGEIKNMSKKVISGVPIQTALENITQKIDSNVLNRIIGLIKEGLEKGGELAILLEQIANDVIRTKTLKREIAAQVGMYAIFIFFAVGIGAPMLYGVSTFLVQTMTKISASVDVGGASAVGQLGAIKFQKIEIDINFLIFYEIASLLITSIFGSLLLGLIKEGREKAGVKYIPLLLIMNISIYFLAIKLLGTILVL